VDNVTHAFVGAAMAEYALPRVPPPRARLLFMGIGIVAANAPDVDVLYSSLIGDEPIGYLLHHRGHSHTVPGLAVLGGLIWAGLHVRASLRSALRDTHPRLWLLIAAALLSHLLMDAGNSYGTHLFYPFSSRWIYGDAVFVIEPWLWVLLGAALALNATTRAARVLVALLTLTLIGVLGALGLLQARELGVVLGIGAAAAFRARTWERKSRAMAVLVATAAMFVLMSGVSRAAKGEAARAVDDRFDGELVDVVADANPGVPWCWAVLTVRKAADGLDALVARRGTLSLVPGLWPAASCPSARLSSRWSAEPASSGSMVWHRQWRIDLEELRALAAGSCRARAWLQFGRVPYVADGVILDLRYENPLGQNFTPTALGVGGCPRLLTDWTWPRRDVLAAPVDHP
jgi:inner membrane protein